MWNCDYHDSDRKSSALMGAGFSSTTSTGLQHPIVSWRERWVEVWWCAPRVHRVSRVSESRAPSAEKHAFCTATHVLCQQRKKLMHFRNETRNFQAEIAEVTELDLNLPTREDLDSLRSHIRAVRSWAMTPATAASDSHPPDPENQSFLSDVLEHFFFKFLSK